MGQTITDTPGAAAPAIPSHRAAEARGPRHDLYGLIHKALRLALTDALVRAGRLDTDDDGEVRATVAAVRDLLALCRMHLDKEEAFVHPALEAAIPGGAGRTAREHDDHLRALDRLESDLRAVERSEGAPRAAAAARLYRSLALFTAENLVHMHGEEVHNNAVLWSAFSDAEIAGIERRIVASIAPAQMTAVLRWLAPALSPAERATFFANLRAKLPPPAFAGAMGEVLGALDGDGKRKLLRALAT